MKFCTWERGRRGERDGGGGERESASERVGDLLRLPDGTPRGWVSAAALHFIQAHVQYSPTEKEPTISTHTHPETDRFNGLTDLEQTENANKDRQTIPDTQTDLEPVRTRKTYKQIDGQEVML